MGKKNVIFFKQAEISQMEKDLNQRTQDAKERDKEVCSLEYATVTAIPSAFRFVMQIRVVCCRFYATKARQRTFLPITGYWVIEKNSSRKNISAICRRLSADCWLIILQQTFRFRNLSVACRNLWVACR